MKAIKMLIEKMKFWNKKAPKAPKTTKEQHIITYGGCFFRVYSCDVDKVLESNKLSCSQVECETLNSCQECCLECNDLDLLREGVEHHIIKY